MLREAQRCVGAVIQVALIGMEVWACFGVETCVIYRAYEVTVLFLGQVGLGLRNHRAEGPHRCTVAHLLS
jgi:hypothetical protein